MLDAGSGPVQWPEYLTYSEGYQYRVCADISIVALEEARHRLGEKGLFVVSDVANLPFRKMFLTGWFRCIPCTIFPPRNNLTPTQDSLVCSNRTAAGWCVNAWTAPIFMARMKG
jgi:SAM-dependent methyltransferase